MDKKQLAETLIQTVLEHATCATHQQEGVQDLQVEDWELCTNDIIDTIKRFEEGD